MDSRNSYHHGDLKNALVKAGIEILGEEGIDQLSLRKVAKKVGVSHSAPYSHFQDKLALIAAISQEGFEQLLSELQETYTRYEDQPRDLLVETSWVYFQFAQRETDRFKLMFSGIFEKEEKNPDLEAVIRRTFQMVVDVVSVCQTAGYLQKGTPELSAMVLWSQIHGMISLFLEGQISHSILDHYDLREILIYTLNQLAIQTI